MTGTEKIAAIFIAILLFVCIALSLRLLETRESIGEKERALNRWHNSQIAKYDGRISSLNQKILTLQAEVDSLNDVKQRIKIVTIREIDSISRLPFDGRARFFAREIARTDSSRTRYLSNGN